MDSEFTLTDEQVENWRKVLITLPLPPLYIPIGAYALIMPRYQVEEVVRLVKELINIELEKGRKKIENDKFLQQSSNIIRSRPRKENKPVRSFR